MINMMINFIVCCYVLLVVNQLITVTASPPPNLLTRFQTRKLWPAGRKRESFLPQSISSPPLSVPSKSPPSHCPSHSRPLKKPPSPAPSPQKAPHEKVPLPLKTPLSPRSMGRKFCCRCGSICPTHPSLSSRNFQRLWDFMTVPRPGPMGTYLETVRKVWFCQLKELAYGFTVKLGERHSGLKCGEQCP